MRDSGGRAAVTADDSYASGEREEPQKASRRRVLLIAVLAVLAAGVGLVVVGAVWLSAVRVDKYDDALRGVNSATRRVNFGQFFSPDGDGCWSENNRVYCDLVSIGGVHWDTGDFGDVEHSAGYIGSGVLCSMTEHGVRCWEWGPGVQPRSARVPDGAVFHRLKGADGFVCGQTPDYKQVICWTIGVDEPNYRQATHRFTDGTEWRMISARNDRVPRFRARQRDTGRGETFDAFTGEELTGQVQEPRLLVTRTTR
jgi:hypothetical protein